MNPSASFSPAAPGVPAATPVVVIVEDDALLRRHLARNLEDEGLAVLAWAGVEEIEPDRLPDGPCVAVLDMRLGTGSGLQAAQRLRQARSGLPLVFLSGESQPAEIVSGMQLAPVEFLLKPCAFDHVLQAVRRGLTHSAQTQQRQARQASAQALLSRLTPRETEVCQLLLEGLKTGEVADRLGMSPSTAKVHRQHVFAKLGVETVGELVRCLRKAGVLDIHLAPIGDAGTDE